MQKLIVSSMIVASASAYSAAVVRPQMVARAQVAMSAADGMEGAAQETGNVVWDPLELADLGSPATLAWFRHAELKHGRIAMAAFVGWLVAVSGVHFPGAISPFQVGTTFEEISKLGPMEQWEAVPEWGKVQIISAIFLIEHQSEWKCKPHYMAGGVPGDLKFLKSFWDPVGFTKKMDATKLKRQRLAELKNGRLAMLGIVGCLVGGNLPGSIPVPINWPAGPSVIFPFGPLSVYQ
jgi:hypothetical protein